MYIYISKDINKKLIKAALDDKKNNCILYSISHAVGRWPGEFRL